MPWHNRCSLRRKQDNAIGNGQIIQNMTHRPSFTFFLNFYPMFSLLFILFFSHIVSSLSLFLIILFLIIFVYAFLKISDRIHYPCPCTHTSTHAHVPVPLPMYPCPSLCPCTHDPPCAHVPRIAASCALCFRAVATVEVPALGEGTSVQLGWIQTCVHMQFINTYGDHGV